MVQCRRRLCVSAKHKLRINTLFALVNSAMSTYCPGAKPATTQHTISRNSVSIVKLLLLLDEL